MADSFLTTIFTASFAFGAAATLLTSLLGLGSHGPIHLPHVGHLPVHPGHVGHLGSAGGAGHGSTGASGSSDAISPLNLSSILAFLVVFGAVGLVLEGGIGAALALLFAILGGLAAGWVAYIFVARFLARGQTFLVDEPLTGTIGTVSVAIGSGRVGEVIYTRNGVRRSDGARAAAGQTIQAGEEVVILSIDHGIATVQPWRQFLERTGK
jgi:hypothetical protein